MSWMIEMFLNEFFVIPDTVHDPDTGGEIDADSAPTYDIYENAQGTGTTPMPVRNRNRPASATDEQATLAVSRGITSPNIGSDIVDHGVAGGGGANTAGRSGGVRSQEAELILRAQTQYAMRITNLSGATADVEIHLFWYEESTSAA